MRSLPFPFNHKQPANRAPLLCISFLFLLSFLPVAQAQAPNKLREDYNEAQAVLQKMHTAVVQLDAAFKMQHPENLANPAWIQLKLETMAVIDQLMRRVLVENLLVKDWEPAVKRAFLVFFFNFDAPKLAEAELGYAQRNDLYNYRELKRLLENSPKLTPFGWPIRSKFGTEADYYAFLIAHHGHTYDRLWQENTLIPRLKKLAEQGETAAVVPFWLSDSSLDTLKTMPSRLAREGGLWEAMIPEVERLYSFFQLVPYWLQAPKIDRFRLNP